MPLNLLLPPRHPGRLKAHLSSHEPQEVLSAEEYEELRAACRQSQKAERAEQAQEVEEERPPGEEEPATPEDHDSVRAPGTLALDPRSRSHLILGPNSVGKD